MRKLYHHPFLRWYNRADPARKTAMALYRELPAAAQTAYAELYELAQSRFQWKRFMSDGEHGAKGDGVDA